LRAKPRQLALVLALAERGTLRRAAADVAVSQPAATKLLADLEDVLGVPLFERHAWGMTPTVYGTALVRHARSVLTDLDEARAEIAALAAGATGKLRVGGVTGAVPRLLAPAIAAMRRAAAGVRVFVLVNSNDVLASSLRQGALDVAIASRPGVLDASDLDISPLADEPLVVVARARHPLARSRRVALASLATLTWIVQPPEGPLREAMETLFARAQLPMPTDLVETVSIVATLALLQQSDAVSLLPLDLARHYEGAALLARLAVTPSPGASSYALMTRTNRPRSPAAEHFIAAIRRIAAER
jgi:DNA-binding transcriptional LysR family regulator